MPYLTPETAPTETVCWRIEIPNDRNFLAAVVGQITELMQSWNWEQFTGISIDDTLLLANDVYLSFEKGTCGMIGSLVHYVTTAPPDHVLPCDGTQYLRTDYPKLYDNLPANLIVDADNFVTPVVSDVFMLASGVSYAPFDTGGAETHQLTVDEMPSHAHLSNYPNFTLSIKTVGTPNIESGSNPPVTVPTSSAGLDSPHNNMPPYIAFKVGIVAK